MRKIYRQCAIFTKKIFKISGVYPILRLHPGQGLWHTQPVTYQLYQRPNRVCFGCVCYCGLTVKSAARFLRRLGLLLHSVPKIKHDRSGDEMVYPWYGEDSFGGGIVQLGNNSSRAKRSSNAAVAG